MRFYTEQHRYYCGIDLHGRTMYVCILDQEAKVLVHRRIRCRRRSFLRLIEPYRDDLVVACECLFCWYWLADLCLQEQIAFVLGHALYMKAIHGGKAKNDRIDSQKIAHLLRGGNFPYAYVYPPEMRATRDLLRRRLFFARKRGELLAHIQNTNTQYNLEPLERRIDRAANRAELLEHFADDEDVQMSVAADMALLDSYEETVAELELYLEQQAKVHDSPIFYLLRSIPGIGKILSMTILYEVHDISRFDGVGNFLSYARLVKGSWESDGKKKRGAAGAKKIGNVHLKWAFSEAAALFLRGNPIGRRYFQRLERKHGKGKALSVLAAKLGRAVYFMWKRHQPFDLDQFVAA